MNDEKFSIPLGEFLDEFKLWKDKPDTKVIFGWSEQGKRLVFADMKPKGEDLIMIRLLEEDDHK